MSESPRVNGEQPKSLLVSGDNKPSGGAGSPRIIPRAPIAGKLKFADEVGGKLATNHFVNKLHYTESPNNYERTNDNMQSCCVVA